MNPLTVSQLMAALDAMPDDALIMLKGPDHNFYAATISLEEAFATGPDDQGNTKYYESYGADSKLDEGDTEVEVVFVR